MNAREYFERLGNTIRSAWERHRFIGRALPDIACGALAAEPPAWHVSCDDLIDWVERAVALPKQANLPMQFGQPPLTVFWDERFFIEALFWTTATTTIHQHGFSGAFHVLAGSSLQARYSFEACERPCSGLLIGDLTLRDAKLLQRGTTEPIVGGNGLIHSIFHLDVPSVTVVVRTHVDEGCRPQYNYLRPYLAVDPQYEDPLVTRRVQMLGLLQRVGSSRYAGFAAAALESSDLWGTFRVLQRVRQHAGFLRVSYQDLLARAECRHGNVVQRIEASLADEDRTARLHARRQKMFDPDHRFFLALVLSLPDHASILSAVRNAFPNDDPNHRLQRWSAECRVSGMWDPWMAKALATA